MGSLDGDLKFEERAVMEHSSRIADDLEAFFPQGWFPAECIDQDVRIKKSSDYVSYYAPPRANESLLLICFWLSGFTPIAAALSLSS
jgi:hypothetical protein